MSQTSRARAQALDILFHTPGAFPFHANGSVSISAERKSGSGMAKVFLESFDIISGFQAVNRKGMPEIMELHISQADLLHDLLIVPINRLVCYKASELIGKHQVVLVANAAPRSFAH